MFSNRENGSQEFSPANVPKAQKGFCGPGPPESERRRESHQHHVSIDLLLSTDHAAKEAPAIPPHATIKSFSMMYFVFGSASASSQGSASKSPEETAMHLSVAAN